MFGTELNFRFVRSDNIKDDLSEPDHPLIAEKLMSIGGKKKQAPGGVTLLGRLRSPLSLDRPSDLTANQKLAQSKLEGPHLVILQHGFEGQASDMKLIQVNLMCLFPHLRVYCPSGNEGKTYESIDEMGKRLAEEICDHIKYKVT